MGGVVPCPSLVMVTLVICPLPHRSTEWVLGLGWCLASPRADGAGVHRRRGASPWAHEPGQGGGSAGRWRGGGECELLGTWVAAHVGDIRAG